MEYADNSIASVVGARPQFIKAAVVSRALAKAGADEFLVHTGQHYDYGMSELFFRELAIREPSFNLGIGSGPHGKQTGLMLAALEETLKETRPALVLIYGDTNSTLAAALAAAKLQIPVAHVEAGLRSFNMRMPEEVNRILADRISALLFCPTDTAVANLAREGVINGVCLSGDVMYDAALFHAERAPELERTAAADFEPGGFYLATVHRAENTDNETRLRGIFSALEGLARPVVLPLHPRTRKRLAELDLRPTGSVRLIDPVGYLEMVALERAAKVILTDSGGMQKEALFHRTPCVTLRDETEWVETVESGWNRLVGADAARIVSAVEHFETVRLGEPPALYGDGDAGGRIAAVLCEYLGAGNGGSA
ncbi:MAG: non-hydrolyzing UDP-N-acetylglucosamine 2-epimerase [Planctomycetota bacterium]|jgi:UDP-N-acetylglucosamine 2-epimerase